MGFSLITVLECFCLLIHLEAYHHFPTKSWGSIRKQSNKNSNGHVIGVNMERGYQAGRSTMCTSLRAAPKLLPDPLPNSIGNFFENTTDGMSFIQCFMLSIGELNDAQYGVGFPVDMPVMLTYFEGNDLRPVTPEYPDYDHLMNHVAVQLDSNDFQLYRTPVVLTLQGEFEDDELNEIIPGQKIGGSKNRGRRGQEEDAYDDEEEEEDYLEGDEDEDEEDDEEGEGEEITIDELVAMEGIDEELDEEDAYGDEDDLGDDEDVIDDDDEEEEEEEENKDMDSFWRSSPAGKMDEKYAKMPDVSIFRPENPDISDIPADAFVTDEDTKSLRRAHRRADRIMEYATDVKLIASFHYKKRNFHLVRLLEPIFIVGKRINDIKGYYFTLLDDDESARVMPVLEGLLAKRPAKRAGAGAGGARSRGDRGRRQVASGDEDSGDDTDDAGSSSGAGAGSSGLRR